MLAKIARRYRDRVVQFSGVSVADQLEALAEELGDTPARQPHSDPFIQWLERERLTLAPTVELVDPRVGKIDWLMLPEILERDLGAAVTPPPVFAMFNVLKADFILARDLTWRATNDSD